jgi:BirA family biotin operon repressor/biotin-[acetyl-CoA-carboxylase] ligase
VDSTNETASALSATRGIASASVIIADAQEKGRGRLGRRWVSPAGLNIYMSIVMKPEIRPEDATLFTVIGAVASAGAVRKESGLDIRIKWPNDLMVSGKKLGGILTEVKSDPDRINLAIVGIGINVNMEEAAFPGEIWPIATSMRLETGRHHQRSGIIAGILKEFEHWYNTLLQQGRAPLLDEWRRFSSTIGRNVRVTVGRETMTGEAEEIDDEGMLILRLPSGLRKRISAGDLTELR